jgi:DNA-binding MarR family transcriptional regulator
LGEWVAPPPYLGAGRPLSQFPSVAEALVTEVLLRGMTSSTPRADPDRLAVGQLLVRLLHRMRMEVFLESQPKIPAIRFPHLQIIGNIVGTDGIRLTDLANKAALSLAACSELVNDLESLGFLERRPDPSDGRAKLISPTAAGRKLLDAAARGIEGLEGRWRSLCPPGAFDEALTTLDRLLRELEGKEPGPGGNAESHDPHQ